MAQVYLSQYARRAAVADSVEGTASYAATASYVNPIRLDPIQDPNPTGLLYTSSTYLYQSSSNTPLGYDMYIRQDGNVVKWKWIEGMLNTGLLYGGVLSYSASSFLITSGAGLIVNHNAVTGSEINPIVEYVTWGPITQSIENIATFQNTFVYIDVSGSASQQNVFFSPDQYQEYIPIGRISHYDNVVTNGSNMNVQTVYDIDGQQNVFVRAFGPLKLTGIDTSGQAGTLRLNIGSGRAFSLGQFYPYNPETPSTYDVATYNTASIVKIYRDGAGEYVFDNNSGNYYTTITANLYDDGTGTLASVGNGEWTIQRVMVNPVTGRAHVYYGQNKYTSYDDAVGSIFSDEFTESDATAYSYVFSAYLVVRGNTTDLTDAGDNKIVQAGLFRNIAGGGGTGGGGIPGGQDTQIQFNNNGVFDGEPEFTYNYTDSIVILTGSMIVSGAIFASSGSNTIDFYGTSSWAQSASNALFAQTSSFITASNVWGPFGSSSVLSASFASSSVSASYASSSPNFANTNLVFTDNRKHDTNRYSYFIYSDLVGGNETDPFDGFGVSGSFHYFNTGSNVLGTAAGSTNTYTYIKITSQSIDLSFNADPAVPSIYAFTNQQAYFSSSLAVTKSVYFPGLTSLSQPNVVVIDTASGQLYYLNSSSLGGSTANVAISSSGTGLTATVESINFAGAGVTITNNGNDVTVTIPGGAGVAGGADTQIQFNSGSEFSGSGNFSFDYVNNIVYLTGSSLTSGSITLTGSMLVNGSISSSLGPNTVGFHGTASWAQNALTASFITASNVYGPFGSSSINSASYASSSTSASYAETASLAYTASFITGAGVFGPFGSNSVLSASYASGSTSASFALTASFASSSNPYPINVTGSTLYSISPASGIPSSNSTISSIFFGTGSGLSATNASQSVFLGENAGRSAPSAHNSNFIGNSAGQSANNARNSNFLGTNTGFGATNARGSNFLGQNAGSGSVNARNSNFLGEDAGVSASNANSSNFIGYQAGQKAFNANSSNFLGQFAGVNATNADNSNFLGDNAGWGSTNAKYSNFLGPFAGGSAATNASQSNFLGVFAGNGATNAHNSNFIGGYNTGRNAINASYSTLIGYQAGYASQSIASIGSNNIIIGTNITLSSSRKDSINIGGIIFGTGSHNNTALTYPSSGSAGGRIGINIIEPTFNLQVSGSIAFPSLTDTSQTNVVTIDTSTGQLFYTASSAFGGGSGTPTPPATPLNSIQFNSASAFRGSAAFTFISSSSEIYLTGSFTTSGSSIITGSTSVLGTSSTDGIALIGTSSAYALYTTAKITTVSGINTIYSIQTASYDGAFFDYTLISGTNARAGQIMSIWSGSEIRYTETTTTDIGSTSEFIFSVALTAGSASLQVTGSTGAVIKTIIKGI